MAPASSVSATLAAPPGEIRIVVLRVCFCLYGTGDSGFQAPAERPAALAARPSEVSAPEGRIRSRVGNRRALKGRGGWSRKAPGSGGRDLQRLGGALASAGALVQA
jgi:hypothetical protein